MTAAVLGKYFRNLLTVQDSIFDYSGDNEHEDNDNNGYKDDNNNGLDHQTKFYMNLLVKSAEVIS
jgi:hypothetical protein